MSIIRTDHNKENPYVMLGKKALEDEDLSWAAKGVWAYLMSRPDNWKVSVLHLSKVFKGEEKGGGVKAIYKLLSELEKNGYCQKKQEKGEGGKFAKYEYIIYEFKIISPLASQRHAVQRLAVKGGTTNKQEQKKKETTTSVVPSTEGKSLSDDQQEILDELISQGGNPITCRNMIKKYSVEDFNNAFMYYRKQKTPKKDKLAYLHDILKNRYWEKKCK